MVQQPDGTSVVQILLQPDQRCEVLHDDPQQPEPILGSPRREPAAAANVPGTVRRAPRVKEEDIPEAKPPAVKREPQPAAGPSAPAARAPAPAAAVKPEPVKVEVKEEKVEEDEVKEEEVKEEVKEEEVKEEVKEEVVKEEGSEGGHGSEGGSEAGEGAPAEEDEFEYPQPEPEPDREAGQAVEAPDPGDRVGRYTTGGIGRKFHRHGCRWLRLDPEGEARVPRQGLHRHASEAAARAAGFGPCGWCIGFDNVPFGFGWW